MQGRDQGVEIQVARDQATIVAQREAHVRIAHRIAGEQAQSRHDAERDDKEQAEQQQQAYEAGAASQAPPAQAPVAQASSGITSQDTERLAELGKLHEQGVLTDEEFAQQKARILGMA